MGENGAECSYRFLLKAKAEEVESGLVRKIKVKIIKVQKTIYFDYLIKSKITKIKSTMQLQVSS